MARKSDRELLRELLERYEPVIKGAFLRAVQEIKNPATLSVIVDRLERGDVAGAVEALQIEPEAFARLEQAIRDTYTGGGIATVENFPVVREPDGQRVVFRFAVRSPEAEEWLREHSAQMVTRTTEDMKQAVRQHLAEGLSEGRNPRETAREVVGKVSRATGRREGGILGLTAPQERYVSAARRELLSGDPEALKHYLTRGRRDRRFDRAVARAIREERPLDRETVDRIVGRYSDRLLELRGEMVAQNETFMALEKAREDAIMQQIRAGKIAQEDVQVIWRHTPQENPRLQHVAMHGKSVPLGEDFVLPDGTRMKRPHDPNAPADHLVFCKCRTEYKVDFLASVVRRHRAAA